VGKLNTAIAPLANKVAATPGSLPRRLLEKTVGIASERVLPPYARQRFSAWVEKRKAARLEEPQGRVALFPTCLVEYHAADVGRDLVRVYERNGVECSLPSGQVCCGAPWLHEGHVEHFTEQAAKNIEVLAAAVRDGKEIVVPQPTCSYVIKNDYPDYVGGDDAVLVAEHTYDAAEYLWQRIHKGEGTELDTEFEGEVPASVTYHAPCQLRAQNIGYKSRDLLKLTGTKVAVVAECSGIDGTWGLRAENYELARGVAKKMKTAIEAADNELIAGDCNLANGGILLETGRQPVHPLQVLARAYGIPEE
jgi:Fe-S oxidoreductase